MREICENLESDIFLQLNIWLEYEVSFLQAKNVLSVEIIVYNCWVGCILELWFTGKRVNYHKVSEHHSTFRMGSECFILSPQSRRRDFASFCSAFGGAIYKPSMPIQVSYWLVTPLYNLYSVFVLLWWCLQLWKFRLFLGVDKLWLAL